MKKSKQGGGMGRWGGKTDKPKIEVKNMWWVIIMSDH